MVYRKRTKRTFRKKRSMRRRRVYRNRRGQNVHLFKRRFEEATVTVSNTDVVTTINVRLQDLPNFTEFTALYRQYKINAIKVNCIPRYNNVAAAGDTTTLNIIGQNGRVFIANSYDEDFNTAGGTTLDDIRQLQGVKVKNSNKSWSHYCPKPAFGGIISVNQDQAVASGTRPARGWLDTELASINHLGVAIGFEGGANYDRLFLLEITVYLAFKGYK